MVQKDLEKPGRSNLHKIAEPPFYPAGTGHFPAQILQSRAAFVPENCLNYRQPKGTYDRGSHLKRMFE